MIYKGGNWNYFINLSSIDENHFDNFEKRLKTLHEDILALLDDGHLKTHKYDCNSNNNLNFDEELKRFIERNKDLHHIISLKSEDILKQQNAYEGYKKDQKLLSQGIISRHEAYLMAKKYYKKFLKMYCTIESKNSTKQVIYVQFFTEFKKESENNLLRLEHDIESDNYKLLDVTPKLHIEKEIRRILQETNDLPGLLCCIRQAFITLRSQNKNKNLL